MVNLKTNQDKAVSDSFVYKYIQYFSTHDLLTYFLFRLCKI